MSDTHGRIRRTAAELISRGWARIRRHYSLYPFLALYSALVFYEIISTLQKGVLIGGDNGEYLFASFLILHGRTSIFEYNYPLLPVLYLPVVAAFPNATQAYIVSDLATGVILTGLFAVSYLFFLRETGSKIGAILGSTALASLPLFMDEAGWGGQSQFLAFFFGILAVRAYLSWTESPRVVDGLTVGLLIAAGALSEGWVTFFFVCTLGISIVLWYRRKLISRTVLKTLIAAAVPIGSVYLYLEITAGSNLVNGLRSLWLFQVTKNNDALRLAERFAVGEPVLLASWAVLAGVWLVLQGFRLMPSPARQRPLLLPSLAAFLVQFLLLTSVADGDRGIYFAALPLALTFARLGASVRPAVVSLVQAEERSPSPTSFRTVLRREAPVAATLMVVALLGVQIGFSGLHLSQALVFYSTPTSDLNQLSFLRNETGSVALLGLSSISVWPYTFATGQSVYRATEPALFTRTSQEEGALNATLMQAGPRWIDAGGLRVVDATGLSAESTPGIFEYSPPYDIEGFWLNDALLPFAFSPVTNHSVVWHESPYYASLETTHITSSGTFVANYLWNTLNLTKEVSVLPGGVVRIQLDFGFSQAYVRSIEVRLFCGASTSVNSAENHSGTYSVDVVQDYQTNWIDEYFPSTVNLSESNISLGSFAFVRADQWGIPELQFTLNSSLTTARFVQVNLTIQPHGLALIHPSLITESQWFESIGARWVVAARSAGTPLLGRLQSDPELELYRTTSRFVIYQVTG